MPLFKLFRLADRKLGPTQEEPTSCSADPPPFITENSFPELARGNGQVLMQGFSNSKGRKSLPLNTNPLTPHSSRLDGEDNAGLSEFPASVPSGEVGMNQEDDLVPWLNYPIPGSLYSDYSSDFWPGLPSVAVNETSVWHGSGSAAKTGQGQLDRDSLFSPLQNGNGLEEATETSSMQVFSSSLPLQPRISFDLSLESQREECEPSNSTSGAMNFSDFVRPAAVLSDMDASVDTTNSGNSNPVPCLQTSVPQQRVGSNSAEGKSFTELVPAREHEDVALTLEDALKDSKQSRGSGWTKQGLAYGGNRKTMDPVCGYPLVCSGNSTKRASDDQKNGPKRKSHETQESEGCSEDDEEKFDCAKKQNTAGHTPVRTGRAAEVQNLSERRRRDRINGKICALQELIPNNNKADKASVLDEAIEYVKTLKLQLQMMTTGSGLYMAPMMLPAGMQHMGLDFMTGMPHMNIQWCHFAGSVVPGMAAMAGPVYSLHDQGLPLSLLPNNACGVPEPVQNQDQATVSSGKESAQSIDKQSKQDTSSTCSTKQ